MPCWSIRLISKTNKAAGWAMNGASIPLLFLFAGLFPGLPVVGPPGHWDGAAFRFETFKFAFSACFHHWLRRFDHAARTHPRCLLLDLTRSRPVFACAAGMPMRRTGMVPAAPGIPADHPGAVWLFCRCWACSDDAAPGMPAFVVLIMRPSMQPVRSATCGSPSGCWVSVVL